MMYTFLIRPYHPTDEATVIALWRICSLAVSQNDPHKDITRKMNVSPEMFLVGCVDGTVVATCMVGYEGHRGWINYLAVHPDHQRRGYGTQLMKEAERLLRQAGCPKMNILIRTSNSTVAAFYKRIGFLNDDVSCLSKRLEQESV